MIKASCLAVTILLAASAAGAQDPTGAIEGAVTDSSAAAVVAARVTAKNMATGLTREAVAAGDGSYRVLALPVGTYVLTVEAPRFARVERREIQINVSQTVRVDVQLEPA